MDNLAEVFTVLNSNRTDASTAIFGVTTEEKKTINITFKTPFPKAPKVVASYSEPNAYDYGKEICIYNISTTGFTAETFISPSGASLTFNWIAVCCR